MSFIDNSKQEFDPKIPLKLTPELKEDYLQDLPFKLEECTVESWKVISVPSEKCGSSIEKPCLLYTPVLLDKEGNRRYLTFCEETLQDQTAALDQPPSNMYKLDCTNSR